MWETPDGAWRFAGRVELLKIFASRFGRATLVKPPPMPPRALHPFWTRRQALSLLAAGFGALLLGPAAPADSAFAYGKDINGHDTNALGLPDAKFVSAVFVATDCPVSNRYLPLLARLAKQLAPRGVQMWLVYPNSGDTVAVVQSHQLQYPAASSLRQLIAPNPEFIAHAHVHVTPEAAIFRAGSVMNDPVLWHGRIDDRYLSFGTQRPAATRHDLADALDALLAGRKPLPAAAPPVGCAILPRT